MDSEIDQIIQNILNDNTPTISGGSLSGGRKGLPRRLQAHHKKVMKIYKELVKKSPNKPRNKLLTQAMIRSRNSKRRSGKAKRSNRSK